MQKTLTIIGVSVLMTLVCYANIVKAGTIITPDIPKGYITGKIIDHYEPDLQGLDDNIVDFAMERELRND